MHTEQTEQKEAKQAPKKTVTRKEQLLAKKSKGPGRITKKEQEELDEILAAEKAEQERDALLHRLRSSADKYGRKAIGRVKREVTDRVKGFSSKESEHVAQQMKARKRAQDQARAAAKKEMQRIQTELNAKLAKLESDSEVVVSDIRAEFKDQYREAEQEINNRVEDITNEVAQFVEDIQVLPLESLQELEDRGTVQLPSDDDSTVFIVVPGRPDPS